MDVSRAAINHNPHHDISPPNSVTRRSRIFFFACNPRPFARDYGSFQRLIFLHASSGLRICCGARRFLLKIARVLLFCVCFATFAAAQQSSITPESLRTWLTYLASDDLEGRATFSEGLGLAAAYIAEQLKEAGGKPGGDHGTYFQRGEARGIKSTSRWSVTVEGKGQKRTFKSIEGVRCPANVGAKRMLTFDQVEFVGYGLNLDAEHNDYKGIDVKGKAVVWLGSRGPTGTNQQQTGRLLRSRDEYVTAELGAGAAIAPPPEPFGGQRGGRGQGSAAAPQEATQGRGPA